MGSETDCWEQDTTSVSAFSTFGLVIRMVRLARTKSPDREDSEEEVFFHQLETVVLLFWGDVRLRELIGVSD